MESSIFAPAKLVLSENPEAAKYLLRFDDICPTMNWEMWSEIEALLIEHQVKPLLAVVPDNQDPTLKVGPPVADFWQRVRNWQARGWTIALHGYQHLYVSRCAGIVAVRKKSEFAGLSAAEQEEKLRRGLEIFEREGVETRVWIAPGHSFDAVTVSLLPKFGIQIISDGYFRYPYATCEGLIWVPMQTYGLRPAPAGVWTVCFHHNHWTDSDLRKLRGDVERFRGNLWSIEDALSRYRNRRSFLSAYLCTSPRLSQLIIRCLLKLWSVRNPATRSTV